MGVEAGHIVIDNLHLLTSKVGVLIQDDLVLLAVLWMEGWEVGGAPYRVTGCSPDAYGATGMGQEISGLALTEHFGPEIPGPLPPPSLPVL